MNRTSYNPNSTGPESVTHLPVRTTKAAGWGCVEWDEVRDLVTASYLRAAPKRLTKVVEAGMGG